MKVGISVMANRPIVLAAVVVSLAALVASACSSADPASQPAGGEASESAALEVPERYVLEQAPDFTMTLTSTSVGGTFGRLDRKHTCERGDSSPHLAWEGVPDGAESLALVVDDPASDVVGFDVDVLWAHWVVYSIPPDTTELEPGQVAGDLLDNGAKQGTNDYEGVQYNGPCPIPNLSFPTRWSAGGVQSSRPNFSAEVRPYQFKLYALDTSIDLAPGADRDALLQAIDGHIVAAGQLAIHYKSSKKQSCSSHDPDICLNLLRR